MSNVGITGSLESRNIGKRLSRAFTNWRGNKIGKFHSTKREPNIEIKITPPELHPRPGELSAADAEEVFESFTRDWQWLGTGRVTILTREQEVFLVVTSRDDGSTLLESKVQSENGFVNDVQEQPWEIYWLEENCSRDLCLRFNERSHFDQIWENISHTQISGGGRTFIFSLTKADRFTEIPQAPNWNPLLPQSSADISDDDNKTDVEGEGEPLLKMENVVIKCQPNEEKLTVCNDDTDEATTLCSRLLSSLCCCWCCCSKK